MNQRGQTIDRKHKTLNPDVDSEYWDFTFYEMGKYDISKAVEYVH